MYGPVRVMLRNDGALKRPFPALGHAVATQVFELAAVVGQPEIVELMVGQQGTVVAIGTSGLLTEQMQAAKLGVAQRLRVAPEKPIERAVPVAAHGVLECCDGGESAHHRRSLVTERCSRVGLPKGLPDHPQAAPDGSRGAPSREVASVDRVRDFYLR